MKKSAGDLPDLDRMLYKLLIGTAILVVVELCGACGGFWPQCLPFSRSAAHLTVPGDTHEDFEQIATSR